MASITIRNLDDSLKQRLRVRAAEHGRSMEEEVREILRKAVGRETPPRDLAAALRRRAAPLGGVDLDVSEREPMREPEQFDCQIAAIARANGAAVATRNLRDFEGCGIDIIDPWQDLARE